MKFSNLKKAALLSVLAAGIVAPEAYASNPGNVNSDIQTKVANGDSFQSIFDWLRTQAFDVALDLLDSYKYFFQLLPGWAAQFVPDPPVAFFGGNVVGNLAAGTGPDDFVIISAVKNADGKWEEDIKVTGEPEIPVPIDGGASLLLAAGAAYGLKRFRKSKGENPEGEQK